MTAIRCIVTGRWCKDRVENLAWMLAALLVAACASCAGPRYNETETFVYYALRSGR